MSHGTLVDKNELGARIPQIHFPSINFIFIAHSYIMKVKFSIISSGYLR